MQSGRIGQELIEGEDAVEAVRDFVYGSVPSSVEALNRKKSDSSSWDAGSACMPTRLTAAIRILFATVSLQSPGGRGHV